MALLQLINRSLPLTPAQATVCYVATMFVNCYDIMLTSKMTPSQKYITSMCGDAQKFRRFCNSGRRVATQDWCAFMHPHESCGCHTVRQMRNVLRDTCKVVCVAHAARATAYVLRHRRVPPLGETARGLLRTFVSMTMIPLCLWTTLCGLARRGQVRTINTRLMALAVTCSATAGMLVESHRLRKSLVVFVGMSMIS
jgi:hypothetical protein